MENYTTMVLDKIVDVQKAYSELYDNGDVIGITNNYVQLTEERFLELFGGEYEVELRDDEYDELTVNYKGLNFIALSKQEVE